MLPSPSTAVTILTRIRAPAAIVFDDCFPPVAIQVFPYSSRGMLVSDINDYHTKNIVPACLFRRAFLPDKRH